MFLLLEQTELASHSHLQRKIGKWPLSESMFSLLKIEFPWTFRLVFPSASPRKLGPSSVGQESVSLLVYKSDQGECNSIPSTLEKLEGQAN